MKKADYFIIVLVGVLSLLPLFWLLRPVEAGTVVVSEHGKTVYSGSIQQDHIVQLSANTIQIKDGVVTMLSADCPDHTCQKGGPATSSHPIVCLPNEVIVTILSQKEPELDGYSY